ncbi:uncharacterized protein si:dkey-234i14.6 isoform X3 [Dunckerocampus dactyliophorus]|uniref:uncharacterized protein si:dkey-234i14.6 isoform X3 n=1 Tax=Dunckerocampus dactyliophorus TaxID=161453 RepID=UPI002405B213|nr:uncharacterized protein si:dkey-234i14.6 isoform X3 [Dunckerocampus dactyliophorus]
MDALQSQPVGAIGEEAQDMYRTLAFDTALSTLLAVAVYVALKVGLDGIRQWRARISVLIVGSGPVGLTAALVAVRSGKVLKLTVLDERYRSALLCRPQQIALDPRSVKFLLGLGVDFDNMEGCWHNEHFFTRIGVFQEYLLSILEQKKQKVDVKVQLGTKFTEEYLRRMPHGEWPRVIVVADGSCGDSCTVLGLSSDYTAESCHAYGANASIERLDQRQVPTPEIRAHNLYFDLSAYGVEALREHRNTTTKSGFHLKIYGTFRNRYMALVCPASDTKMVRFLRHTANSSCSRRLFEIQLSHRHVTAAYIEGDNVAVTVEGEAARVLNYDTGGVPFKMLLAETNNKTGRILFWYIAVVLDVLPVRIFYPARLWGESWPARSRVHGDVHLPHSHRR